MKKAVIIEDQTAIREMISTVVKTNPNFEVVAEIGDGQEAYNRCLEIQPDFIILDVMLPSLNGTEVLRRLTKKLPQTRFLVFSGYQNVTLVNEVLQAGAHGFVEKSAPLSELKKGIEAIAADKTYFGPEIAELLRVSVLKPQPNNKTGIECLSKREREVLQLIAESHSTKDIADKLDISKKTAENHRSNVMKKLGLHNVAGLTRYAIRNGLIDSNFQPQ